MVKFKRGKHASNRQVRMYQGYYRRYRTLGMRDEADGVHAFLLFFCAK